MDRSIRNRSVAARARAISKSKGLPRGAVKATVTMERAKKHAERIKRNESLADKYKTVNGRITNFKRFDIGDNEVARFIFEMLFNHKTRYEVAQMFDTTPLTVHRRIVKVLPEGMDFRDFKEFIDFFQTYNFFYKHRNKPLTRISSDTGITRSALFFRRKRMLKSYEKIKTFMEDFINYTDELGTKYNFKKSPLKIKTDKQYAEED